MNININYTFSLEILLMICFVYIFLVCNTFCSCCNVEKVIEILRQHLQNTNLSSY